MERYRVKPGNKIRLKDWNPGDTSGVSDGKEAAKTHLLELSSHLNDLQELLYAQHKHKFLVILQGMDTSGKDSTIRHVFKCVDPLGVKVVAFRVPTVNELDYDYLWRVHQQVPRKGEIAIFNRSHYEDVAIVRVHGLVPESVWTRRYAHIRNFEQMLVDEGTTILKFFLHIDREEQKKRLQSRLDKPAKQWKFQQADVIERRRWADYMAAYEDAIAETATAAAPWYIVPSNHKWYRNLVVATILRDSLAGLNMEYPSTDLDVEHIVIE